MKTLLERARSINALIQRSGSEPISFPAMARTLSDTIGANVYILSRQYKVLGHAFLEGFSCPTMEEIVKQQQTFPADYVEFLSSIVETQANICLLYTSRCV